MGGDRDFKFGRQVDHSKYLPVDDKLHLKGRGQVTWPISNFWGPTHISGMAEARVVKFTTHVGGIKS